MGSLISVLFAMALSIGVLTNLYTWLDQGIKSVMNALTANQAVAVSAAYARYVKDHGAELAVSATPTRPVNVSIDTLKTSGYLAGGVQNINSFGQQWAGQVLQPVPGQLQTMLFSTGGQLIPPSQLVAISAQSSGHGNFGGFVPYAGQAGDATMQPDVAVGAGGSFRQPLANYANPGSGHLAMMLAVADAQADNGFLYRVDMKPGRPDLNNMQTDFGMTGTDGVRHNINGAATVTAQKFQLDTGSAMTNDQGGALELGDITGNHPGQSPYIDLHYGGQGAQDYNVRVMNDANNRLSIYSASGQAALAVQGTIQPANIVTPGAGCSSNGMIAVNADGSGVPFSCQYGTWQPIGGKWLRYGYYQVADGWSVPAPQCSNGGIQRIQVTPQNFSVNDTATINNGPATWNGNGWTVRLIDGQGNGIPGAQAIAATYCAY